MRDKEKGVQRELRKPLDDVMVETLSDISAFCHEQQDWSGRWGGEVRHW